ncbi:Protein TMA23 [Pseudocercospora fuligena]|uniref:Protein TMA23 n=1 Tax=Pseudocercospora fuligena TaxID=685502 RepID=A0A8H6RKI4_9PEZI|nr:Protein TMA23 [Pseudocercospora fuligena]
MAAGKGMDAASYLKKHGWKGDGHSLDPSSRGIKKPLLVSKKVDVLGVGLNKHAAVSDQWWMRAFDQGLKDLGTGKTNALTNIREHGMFAGGLYGRFVKGEGVAGTFAEEISPKRKREDDVEDGVEVNKKQKVNAEHEEAQQLKRGVDGRVEAFVAEAQRRGLLDVGDKKPTRSDVSPVTVYGEAAVQLIFKQAGLSIEGNAAQSATKEQKYKREKQLRELKRAAKSFITFRLSNVERKQIEAYEASIKKARKSERKSKDAGRAAREAEKTAAKEAKALRKKEKREKKLAAREQDNEDSAYGTDEAKENIPAPKLAKYEAKAAAKGISVQQYIQNRERIKAAKGSQDSTTSSTPAPAFVVDTDGDAALNLVGAQLPPGEHVVDSECSIRFTVDPKVPVPLDPAIWDGIKVKTLPKSVREARRQWMENKREARNAGKTRKSADQSKGEKKLEKIEKLCVKILVESRKARGSGTVTIDGIEDVPLVKVEAKAEGPFSKEEMGLARTVARRVLKEQKRKAESNGKKKSRKEKTLA